MAEKGDLSISSSDHDHKRVKRPSLTNSLVLDSLASALDPTVSVVLGTERPSPQHNKQPKSSKLNLSNLLRPLSPGFRSDSDDSSTSASPKRKQSGHRKKRFRFRNGQSKSADSSPVRGEEQLNITEDVETTQPITLPGQPADVEKKLSAHSIGVPTILVSPDEEGAGLERKCSQSSHLSASSILTSGFGTPSGGEDDGSDQDSLRSPLSLGGFNDEDTQSSSPAPTDGETDYIDVDLPSPSHTLTLPPSRKEKKRKWHVLRKAVHWAPFVQVYKKKYPWVQLAGHAGNFSPGEESGTILKKSSQDESTALQRLMNDVLKDHVPEFKREIIKDNDVYIEMIDLLRDFDDPSVMDLKMGIRTYVESELTKVKGTLRPDMYEKMIAVDPNEPTDEEHQQKAITKPRYMQWRETLSSTATLGFRIEGIKMGGENPMKEEFKTVRAEIDVKRNLVHYIKNNPDVKIKFLQQLYNIRHALEQSLFFKNHEVIGSSLLFVYDSNGHASISLIDFGKTFPLPEGISIDHRKPWEEGNHEDGYLYGLDNLIEIWKTL